MEREYPSRPIVSVPSGSCKEGVVVCKGSRVLLVCRGQEPRKGEWSIPGGVIELGETIRETARREVQEECGIRVQVGKVLDVIDAIYRDKEGKVLYHYVLVDVVATHLSGELKPGSDIDEARWVTKEELPQFDLPDKTLAVILRALERDG